MRAMPRQVVFRRIVLVLTVLAGGAALVLAQAAGSSLDQLEVTAAWARPAPAGDNSAVYLTITNHGAADVVLVGAETDAAHMAEIHETVMEVAVVDGRLVQNMQMQHGDRLVIPAGGSVNLRPGGLHLMLIGLTRDLEVGQSITVRLVAADGSVLELAVPVSQGAAGEGHSNEAQVHAGH